MYPVAMLVDRANMGASFVQLQACEYPLVKVETCNIGAGLVLTYTEHLADGLDWTQRTCLVWVSELACHPLCSFLGRECQGNLSTYDWLKKIEKKHLEWLDRLPTV